MRMLLIPAVCLAVFGLLGFRSMTAQVVLLLECCPSAAITSVFAVQFGHDEALPPAAWSAYCASKASRYWLLLFPQLRNCFTMYPPA